MRSDRKKTSREQGYYGPSLLDLSEGAIVMIAGIMVFILLVVACFALGV